MAAPLLTCDEWIDWVCEPPQQTTAFPTRDRLQRLMPSEQEAVHDLRRAHNAREITVINEPVQCIYDQVQRRHLLNRQAGPKARYGFVLGGPPRTGKTTILTAFGKQYEMMLRRKHPERFEDHGGARYLPVVYFSLPQAANEKTISKGLAEYLNVPYLRKDNEQDITRKVLRALHEMRTEFLLIDEVHNLGRHGAGAAGRRAGQVANDYLKNLFNYCSATAFLAGADVETTGLFSEFHGARITQTAGRFTYLGVKPYGAASPEELQCWRELVHAMERPLHLYDHRRGDLAKLGRHLHDRTGGYVGTLAQLIREAAVLAIDTGRERIDLELLEMVASDKQSADAYLKIQEDARKEVRKQAAASRRRPSEPVAMTP